MQPMKKWMVVLTNDQYDWIKSTSEKAEVSGATVLRALITEAMDLNSHEFRRSLQASQLKAELQALEEKEEQIAAKKKELQMKLTGQDGSRKHVTA